jgi:hypothetical protein
MADINEILGKQINSVKELKSAIKELQDSLIGVDADSEQFKTTTEQLAAAQAELNKVTKAGTQDNVAAKDSLVGMRQEYKALYDQYKLLTEEQRKSDFGKAMADSLETLSNKINDTQKGIGDFRGNVGRYAQSITDAFNGMGISLGALQTPLKLATGGANTFGKALKALAANPIILILTGLVAILAKAAEAIKKNEELTNRLQQAFSVFRPVLDAVANAFDFLAGLLVKTVEGLSKVAEKVMSIIPGMKQAVQSHKDLEKATQNLTKATREANIENSKKQAEIERLREEASATEDVVEKKRLLEEAKAMQAEVDQKNIELAQEELRIMQEYGDKTANSAEENEKLAAAQKKVNDAIAQGERNQRMYNKQLDQTNKNTKSAASSGKNYREEAKKLYEELVEESKTEITITTEKYKKQKALLEKYNLDTTLLTRKYERDIQKIREEEWNKQRNEMRNMFNEYADNLKRYYNNLRTIAESNDDITRVPLIDAEQISEAYDKLQDFLAKSKKLIGDTNDNLAQALNILFNNADMSKLTDYDYVESILKHFADESLLKEFYTFGKEGWKEFIKGFEDDIQVLNIAFGVDIKNLPDAEAAGDKLGHDLAESFGNAAKNEIQRQKRELTMGMYDVMYNILKNNTSESGGVIYDIVRDYIRQGEYAMLELEKDALQVQIDNFSGTTEQKIAILEQYYSVQDELRQRNLAAEELDLQRRRQIWDDAFDNFMSITNTTNTILDSIVNVRKAQMDADLKEGKISKQEYDKKKDRLKKLEQLEVAVAVAGIAANTAAGIMDVWRGYSAELLVNTQTAAATGPAAAATKAALDAKSLASAIIRTTTLTIEGGAQIAAAVGGYIAKSTAAASEDSSGGVGVAATPTLIDSTPYSYTRTVQTQEEYDALNRPIWVSVEDISNGLGHQVNVRDESSF